jgi:hypothetical protein
MFSYIINFRNWKESSLQQHKEERKILKIPFDEQEKSLFFYKQQKNSYRIATNPSLKQTDKLINDINTIFYVLVTSI